MTTSTETDVSDRPMTNIEVFALVDGICQQFNDVIAALAASFNDALRAVAALVAAAAEPTAVTVNLKQLVVPPPAVRKVIERDENGDIAVIHEEPAG